MATTHDVPWQRAHDEAEARGEGHYRDPTTGYRVFTASTLQQRGRCCGCGCRHCPWAHEAIPMDARAERIAQPAMLHGALPALPARVLFWSGGKDSFLALRALLKTGRADDLVLLTTFGMASRTVAHQELPLAAIVEQAKALNLPLLGVPLPSDAEYTKRVAASLSLFRDGLKELAFGDLHLAYIREWREKELGPLAVSQGASLRYPIWQVGYDALLLDLEESGARVRVCAAPDPSQIAPCAIGDVFGAAFVDRLPDAVDRFGESGEFHSYVEPATLERAEDTAARYRPSQAPS